MTKFSWLRAQATGLFLISLVLSTSSVAQDQTNAQNDQPKPQMLELWSPGDSGQRMRIRGRVTGPDGSPISNVHIRFRHADSAGLDRSYHQGELQTNDRGVYQFGSVIPGNNHRLSHVHVYINHPDFQYVETEFYFKDDPKANPDDPNAIFLEEGNANGEKMMYGRWDVVLTPR